MHNEIHYFSINRLLGNLLQNIREYIGSMFQLNADVAELDLITSLAQVSSLQTYTRPLFGSKLELVESRHPIMDVFSLDGPIPNDVVISFTSIYIHMYRVPEMSTLRLPFLFPFVLQNASIPRNLYVISGPNMSGKSTYLKQIVLLHIMAQIGCFVPAKKAMFRITDLIFCKIAIRDDIECNASTFALEVNSTTSMSNAFFLIALNNQFFIMQMKEAQYILRCVTARSLIILDELCKGTAIEEGASIAWAICEKLLNTTAFIFAATHFSYLTKLADLYYNVTKYDSFPCRFSSDKSLSLSYFTYSKNM